MAGAARPPFSCRRRRVWSSRHTAAATITPPVITSSGALTPGVRVTSIEE
jgi:hypothetical protein